MRWPAADSRALAAWALELAAHGLDLLQAREDVLREAGEARGRFLVGHEAGAAREDEMLIRPHPLAVLQDLPVDRVRVAREHETLRDRLLGGEPDQRRSGTGHGGRPRARLRSIEPGRV